MNNNTFSFGRFGAYAQAELFLHRVAILRVFLVYTLIVASYYWLPILITGSASNAPTSVFVFGVTLGIITMSLNGSLAFAVFRKPGGGTFAMQMPVSMAEKFIFRLIGHMVITPILAVTIPRLIWMVLDLTYNISGYTVLYSEFFWSQLAGVSLIQSTFFFGAVAFRKSNFIKTVSCWLIFTILMQVLIHLAIWKFPCLHFNLGLSDNALTYVSFSATIILTLLFVTLSWFRFRKLQILK